MTLSKEFRFEASHQLPHYAGKCGRLHGHSWKLTVSVRQELDVETGMVMDYSIIKQMVQPTIDLLDHRHLGSGFVPIGPAYEANNMAYLMPDILSFNVKVPTSENVLLWIAEQLPNEFPWSSLRLNETCTSECTLTLSDYLQWKSEQKGA